MSLPNLPELLIDYLPNGKAVCADHRLRRCDICYFDFTFGESDEEQPYTIIDQKESGYSVIDDVDNEEGTEDENDGEDDRVFVLVESQARFIPQRDEQVLGPANTYQIKKDCQNPPKALPLSSIEKYYCHICQLTWLVGEIGKDAATNHPSHHSYAHIYCGTSRSVFAFTDGACSGNGTPAARGGIGVFFGTDSRFNLSESLSNTKGNTSQKAELAAVARAMEIVRSSILPTRRTMVTEAKGGHGPRSVSDIMHLRLVIVTDSSYIVNSMCQHSLNWKPDAQGVLVNKSGKIVENSEEFLRVISEVEKLSMVGIQVVYYHVGREENREADRLAKKGIA